MSDSARSLSAPSFELRRQRTPIDARPALFDQADIDVERGESSFLTACGDAAGIGHRGKAPHSFGSHGELRAIDLGLSGAGEEAVLEHRDGGGWHFAWRCTLREFEHSALE